LAIVPAEASLPRAPIHAFPPATAERGRREVWLEVALVWAVFFIEGAWPVPDVNEPYYLGKAIHYWNPEWAQGDFFLQTADAHQVFYFTFGWLAMVLPPLVLAWFGRLLTWGLLAVAWQRLSWAVVPRRGWSILTAALFVAALDRYHMAGEWVVGGVEAKGFAFVLVLFGLETLVHNRWNRAWILFGAAAAFHVLVGGWTVLAAAGAWLFAGRDRPTLGSMMPAIVLGGVLSLAGLIPSARLTLGVAPEIAERANLIYVFARLPHHLAPLSLPNWPEYVFRFAALTLVLLAVYAITPPSPGSRRLRLIVLASLAIASLGLGINALAEYRPGLAAGLLRFYWFRLSDVAVPLGLTLAIAERTARIQQTRPRWAAALTVVLIAAAGLHLADVGRYRLARMPPRSHWQLRWTQSYRLATEWIAHSGQIPPDARFLTPRLSHTFKWYTARPEVATWKDIPQDAASIVAWWDRLHDIYGTGLKMPGGEWYASFGEMSEDRVRALAQKYGAQYVLSYRRPRELKLDVVYRNRYWVVYRVGEAVAAPSATAEESAPP
jgi:hypothetical protein